ncbi:hypothetical protein JCM3766R1_005581 [Sporobolomyces carnicolor]
MAILSFATSAASTVASYGLSAATSYVGRSGAAAPSDAKENVPPTSTSGSSSCLLGSAGSASPSARRLQRHNSSARRIPSYNPSKFRDSTSTSGPSASSRKHQEQRGEAEDLVDRINKTDELYEILGVGKRAKSEEIRRGFLGRSRICHPDKLPHYPPSTTAFQRLSYAYETLSKPSSRRIYDLGGMRSFETGPSMSSAADGAAADETLNGVLRSVIHEFLNGDFEMIRVFVTALNEGSPGLNLGEDAVDNLESAFRKAREVLLAGQKYALLLKFSLIRMYEIQISLRRLSYFDLYGRLRLTMELMRCMVEVPLILDRAMREDVASTSPSSPDSSRSRSSSVDADPERTAAEGQPGQGQLERRGILGVRTKGMLVLTCRVLERAETWIGGSTASPTGSARWEEEEGGRGAEPTTPPEVDPPRSVDESSQAKEDGQSRP